MRQARVLAQATSDLVNAMRSDAEAEIDMENSKKLLAAAKLLADSTARMVEAAKVPGNELALRIVMLCTGERGCGGFTNSIWLLIWFLLSWKSSAFNGLLHSKSLFISYLDFFGFKSSSCTACASLCALWSWLKPCRAVTTSPEPVQMEQQNSNLFLSHCTATPLCLRNSFLPLGNLACVVPFHILPSLFSQETQNHNFFSLSVLETCFSLPRRN